MQLQLEKISVQVGAAVHLHDINLDIVPHAINVLMGATLAGKTTLLRVMAGLDHPSSGRLLVNGQDVTRVPVRKRNLAMVYQQFINYPSLTVFDNIAAPLQNQKRSKQEIEQRVTAIAETLRLTAFLDRHPAELSGGQQQRTALARALAKDAELLLLDEPLVNLDYKLREELRNELPNLFRNRNTTVVYATTEPSEALQLGQSTAILDAGRLLQVGPTLEVFRRPRSLAVARAFSDPPLNVLTAEFDRETGGLKIDDGARLQLAQDTAQLRVTSQVGFRAHQIRLARNNALDVDLSGRVELAEISGSDTYLHIAHGRRSFVAQLPGVHRFGIGDNCTLFIDPRHLFGFNDQGELLFAPT